MATHIELATKMNKDIGLAPFHVFVIFNHAPKEKMPVCANDFS